MLQIKVLSDSLKSFDLVFRVNLGLIDFTEEDTKILLSMRDSEKMSMITFSEMSNITESTSSITVIPLGTTRFRGTLISYELAEKIEQSEKDSAILLFYNRR